MRVCLDTNVLVAAFATRGLCADVLRTVLVDHELVVGEVLLEELDRVLTTKLRVPEARRAAVRAALTTTVVVPRPAAPHPMPLADEDDRWILATAVAGDAEVLVTGDQVLLAAADREPLPVVTPRAFWERLRQGS
ncbi:MAG: putative toxin-antitoxin system toxin component, PIN family [Trueperaceae bacterium]|nr:putative toxin-antitoxin system toxin component, PIN family [Trueperaceae bacterium]